MSNLSSLLALTLLAGLAMPLGALGASVERIRPLWLEHEFRHSVLAFGGGALLSAVTLVLVPQGMAHLSPIWVAVFLVVGGFAFMALDRALCWHGTPASLFMLMLADFVPESIALGAVFALGSEQAMLLALLIAMQNLPEGFNAYRELHRKAEYGRNKTVALFTLAALLGPAAGLAGYQWLSHRPQGMSAVMLLASGGHPVLGVSGPGPAGQNAQPLGAANGRHLWFWAGRGRSNGAARLGPSPRLNLSLVFLTDPTAQPVNQEFMRPP